jgi:hypothetical protein
MQRAVPIGIIWRDISIGCRASTRRKLKFIFRYQKEGFREDLVNLKVHGKPISQIVWASIWRGGWLKLVVMRKVLKTTSLALYSSKITPGFIQQRRRRSGLNLIGFGLLNSLYIHQI